MLVRFFTFSFLLLTTLQALTLDTIQTWYQEGEYKKVCSNAVGKIYATHQDSEAFINMYAHACLEIDMINRMSIPIIKLIKAPSSRANAVYYSTILYQKKLLYHALVDGIDISYISLPNTHYILSKIFIKFIKKDYTKEGQKLIFQDQDLTVQHKLYITKDQNNIYKMILKTYKDGKIVKTRTYW